MHFLCKYFDHFYDKYIAIHTWKCSGRTRQHSKYLGTLNFFHIVIYRAYLLRNFQITVQSSKNDISSKKEKNYKDSTLNKSNRTLFCYRTIHEASKFSENDDSVEKNGSHILSKDYFHYKSMEGHICIKMLIINTDVRLNFVFLRLTRCKGNALASPVVVDFKGATILFNGGRGGDMWPGIFFNILWVGILITLFKSRYLIIFWCSFLYLFTEVFTGVYFHEIMCVLEGGGVL